MISNVKPQGLQQGSSLIEVLVTLVILMVGLLGLVGLMVQSQRSQMESYQRVQALIILQDMVNRININRKVAGCYALATNASLGTGSTVPATSALSCTATTAQKNQVVSDMTDWNALLLGSAEKSSGNDVGAMLGARGCVVATTSPGVYQVSVVWQGNGKTVAPAGVSCGLGLYGDDTQRRAVSVALQIANVI